MTGAWLPIVSSMLSRPPYNTGTSGVARGWHMIEKRGSTGDCGRNEAGARNLQTSRNLLTLAKEGDERAREVLFERYGPALKRWASGRLPTWARDLVDTDD